MEEGVEAGRVDLLLISPERLANQKFRTEVLPEVGRRSGLLVVDEAHCISDWGHDFRPDYRRIVRVLDLLPRGVPVLCCTATAANDRVVEDIRDQLGSGLVPLRGPLGREGLRLHVLPMPSPRERMAWLAQVVPRLEGTGVIYCLNRKGDSYPVRVFSACELDRCQVSPLRHMLVGGSQCHGDVRAADPIRCAQALTDSSTPSPTFAVNT